MDITLSLSSDELENDDLQDITRELCRDLRDEGVDAEPATEPAAPTDKAGPEIEMLDKIALALIGAGGPLVALIGVLKIYAQRKPSLQFELQRKGGDKLKIKADDLAGDDMTRLVETIEKAVKGMK